MDVQQRTNYPCGTEPQIDAHSRPVIEAQTGKIPGQRCFRLSCSQECCSSTSKHAQMLEHKPSQDTAHNALTSYIGNGLKFAEGFLVVALQKLHLIILTPFSCCFGSSVRQLFIFLSDKSLFLDLWKLGRKKIQGKKCCESTQFYFFIIQHIQVLGHRVGTSNN